MPFVNLSAVDNVYNAQGSMTRLSKGVSGQLVDQGKKGVYVLSFFSEVQGKGNAGRCIDEFKQKYSVVKFPNVISPQLEAMLVRRGFKRKREHVGFMDGHVEVYTWRK